jgi:hypothetical protein
MKLPKVEKADKYVGLYVVDFGDGSTGLTAGRCGVGFTAEEVAELLESEKYKNCKAYKIHRAYPDGRMELKGIRPEIFQLEAGLFFYSNDLETAKDDFERLTKLAERKNPPCRAKVHLAQYGDDKFVAAMIYPAEYDDEVSHWLLDGNYKTSGAAEGGTGAVTRYYQAKPEILDRKQLFGKSTIESRTGEELYAAAKLAVQR